ncbi:Chaoptin [Eumeta japonica]|uniref:Chaoptin n=1 Tax=Eumeta variegata TaxID=151549 RepID=A0A4C1W968_EUMVA|nr:Chaoptin [Eumeta japonica]
MRLPYGIAERCTSSVKPREGIYFLVQMSVHRALLCIIVVISSALAQKQWVPCSELNDDLRYPCRCRVRVDRALQLHVIMDCDRVVFNGDYPTLPFGAPIAAFSQRWSGQQTLPSQYKARKSAAEKLVTKESQWCKIGMLGQRRKGQRVLNLRITSFAGNSERQSFVRLLVYVKTDRASVVKSISSEVREFKGLDAGHSPCPGNLVNEFLTYAILKLFIICLREYIKPSVADAVIVLGRHRRHHTIHSGTSVEGLIVQVSQHEIFSSFGLPLKELDFSHNSLRRLPDRLLAGVKGNITRLVLADNLLGDNLNPIFSTSELHNLPALEELDLSGNKIRGIEEGLLIGCDVLKIFRLDRNNMNSVPSSSLNGPTALKVISHRENRIATIRQASFTSQKSLEEIDLHGNLISAVEGGAFIALSRLGRLDLGRNRLSKFNSDVFQGIENLEKLDLSENFISDFPTVALKSIASLKHLNLSSNMITSIESSQLSSLASLEVLDLSRNNLVKITPGTFVGLSELRYLDVGVNSLRTVEDDAFDGLTTLETLLLRDNNILLIPATALSRLPNLVSVHLGFNRVTALSNDILRAVSDRIASLVLSRNVIRELPPAAFDHFKSLNHLDLSGNLLNSISADVFTGLEQTLEFLSLSQNRILGFTGQQIQFLNLWFLDISDNQLTEIPANAFELLPNLSHLNMSRNHHITVLPKDIFQHNQALLVIDLSHAGLKTIAVNQFLRNPNLEQIYLANNLIQEISEATFKNLKNLTHLDLSYNNIANIKTPAFVNIMSIQYLSLKGNQLNAFKGEFFNTGTSLEVLDLSDNQISYLFPSSFKIHPRLREIILTNNKFNFFPSELISTLQYLEFIDLSGNELKNVDELDFARLPKLRTILLARNELETISEMAFHNSSQIQHLDFSDNRIDRLGDRLFEGLIRLETLNLAGNLLSELPDNVFDRTKLHMLEKINLSNNLFEVAPLKSLQKQFFFVSSVDLSHNQITDIPPDDSVMVNIKKLDLSFNPLSEKTINSVLSEPKTVRDLNLAGTGIRIVSQLETPFLYRLNLSYNNITTLTAKSFIRTTLLESLDISHNKISGLTPNITVSWSTLKNLQCLNLSNNPISLIVEGSFEGLSALRVLDIADLEECTRIEKNAFKSLPNLVTLRAYGYPRLGYFDVQGALQHLLALEKLDVEVKETTIGADQLHSTLHPRLEELGIRGSRLKTVSSGVLAGLKAPAITVRFRNTSVTNLPPALLFPLPRSSQITIDIAGSQLGTLQPQLLVALDDRRADLSMFGLDTNPIRCDCNARALRRWLPNVGIEDVRCASPDHLAGFLLTEIGDDELSCDTRRRTTVTSSSTSASTSSTPRLIQRTSAEPDIIWSVAPSHERPKVSGEPKGAPVVGVVSSGNDDNLIIGIVGGVVAFIAILIVAICIVRLKMTSTSYRGGPLANAPPTGASPVWGAAWPGYAATLPPPSLSTATLPHKIQSGPGSVRYLAPPPPAPYFISLPPHDDKIYR